MTVQEANPDYESCENCIYSDDIVEICILRRCIHAVSSMMERYVPKLSAPTQSEHDENDLDFVQEHKRIPVQLVVSSDCVSRQGAIDAICKVPPAQPERAMKDCRNCKHGNYNDHWGTYFCYHSGDCNEWDKWEPSAQPERKKGRWIRNDNGTYSCSECHSWIPEEQYHYARYCLYCGVNMKD